MSNYAIPHMLKREKRSAIINLSSFAAEHPTPYVTNYSATKSFVDSFSQALSL
jgi:short-subunit dehydrogenase